MSPTEDRSNLELVDELIDPDVIIFNQRHLNLITTNSTNIQEV